MRQQYLLIAAKARRHFWPSLVVGLVITTVLPIGIHTVMLDDLGVPYPTAFPRDGWASVPDHALMVLGAIALNRIIARAPTPMLHAKRGVFLFFVIAAVNQALFRLPIMRNVVSTKWTIYPFVDNAPTVLQFALIAVLVGVVSPIARTMIRKVSAAIMVALITFSMARPMLDRLFAPIVAGNGAREGEQLYTVPYDWHVDVPSYLTYIEPVLGAFAVAMILARLRIRWLAIAAIVFALQGGPLFRVVLNPFYTSSSIWLAMLSEGQFAFEAAALAILVATIFSTTLLKSSINQGTSW